MACECNSVIFRASCMKCRFFLSFFSFLFIISLFPKLFYIFLMQPRLLFMSKKKLLTVDIRARGPNNNLAHLIKGFKKMKEEKKDWDGIEPCLDGYRTHINIT